MKEWIYDHTLGSDMFVISLVVFMFGMLYVGGMWVTHLINPRIFTETCSYQYRNTPISQVPAGCINSRGGLR